MEWSLIHGWQKGLEIDRIDNDGNYEPDNCHFVTTTEQNRNKRKFKNHSIESKIKISQALIGKKQSWTTQRNIMNNPSKIKVCCLYCKNSISKANFVRWHINH